MDNAGAGGLIVPHIVRAELQFSNGLTQIFQGDILQGWWNRVNMALGMLTMFEAQQAREQEEQKRQAEQPSLTSEELLESLNKHRDKVK